MNELRPRLLDLFCCQGGAGMGYHRAGFDVVGVDITAQPRYPFQFIQADAVEYLAAHWMEFDAVHASPPCQAYSMAERINDSAGRFPQLIEPVRDLLGSLPLPWVIENVVGAPLRQPVELCGAMFGLRTYRHRLFESNIRLVVPPHPPHVARQTKMGRAPVEGEFIQVVGNFSGVAEGAAAMGIDWMTRDGLRESIPPAYAEHVGRQLMAHLEARAA